MISGYQRDIIRSSEDFYLHMDLTNIIVKLITEAPQNLPTKDTFYFDNKESLDNSAEYEVRKMLERDIKRSKKYSYELKILGR